MRMINQVFLPDRRRRTQAADLALRDSTDNFLPPVEYTLLLAYMELWALSWSIYMIGCLQGYSSLWLVAHFHTPVHRQAGKFKCLHYVVGGLPVHLNSCVCLKMLCWSFISQLVCWTLCLTLLTFSYIWTNFVKLFQFFKLSVSAYKVWNIFLKVLS